MAYSEDLRWRVISLLYIYNQPQIVSEVFMISVETAYRWLRRFKSEGRVDPRKPKKRGVGWPEEAKEFVKNYVKAHPCFYLDELQNAIRVRFTSQQVDCTSISTICRLLNFDLKLTRKVLAKRAKEALPREREIYLNSLKTWYSYAEQLVFIDETSKDGRDCLRRYARSKRGKAAIVRLPFQRGKRISVVAGITTDGFLGFDHTDGTFTRQKFHESIVKHVLPHLQVWPLPRSIVILDNAKIHCYPELYQLIHAKGGKVIFLPPYSPELNPIETSFALLKAKIKKDFAFAFRHSPAETIQAAMHLCSIDQNNAFKAIFGHSGYVNGGPVNDIILNIKDEEDVLNI
jgi:transposase